MHEGIHSEDPLWYKDAVIYEVHVRAFGDSNNDGIGDFNGLRNKLDYLESLGVTAIWLLPFYPSPLRDDGYDIADYLDVNPDYGTLRHFKELLKDAHSRGIRVITELVLNHTSSDHQWFQKARRSPPGSRYRSMYVWSDNPEKYSDARIIFKDFETSNWSWDPIAKSYYWHRFFSHQPDLNFDNPAVQKTLFKVIDFWLEMGVDGLRLDAVPYLYEREGTNCENLPETHNLLKELRAHVEEAYPNRMLLAEANQWPEDSVAYFGNGDECHMSFHFPLMPRMFMAIQMEDSFPIIDILRSTPAIPGNCQWATFLRNHDELTLEMVTDEERDYMYRVYAHDVRAKINLGIRRRLAPLLGNNRRKIELMNILLLSLPGTPIIYYGDEIGMGDNFYLGDRNGVRTPMQWSADRNAGFSKTNPHQVYLPVIIDPEYHYESINVENQELSPSSLLWWMRTVITVRKKFKTFGRGTFELIQTDNGKVLAFLRKYNDEIILVVVNLSRFSQVVTLSLEKYAGYEPEEVFGKSIFPSIKEFPYMLSIGPFGHYWFLLHHVESMGSHTLEQVMLTITGKLDNAFEGKNKTLLEEKVFPRYLHQCRWFASKARKINRVSIVENASYEEDGISFRILLLRVSYSEGDDDMYILPISTLSMPLPTWFSSGYPQAIICHVKLNGKDRAFVDANYDERVHTILLSLIGEKKKIKGINGTFYGMPGRMFKQILGTTDDHLVSKTLKAEQSNTSVVYDKKFFLKVYRKIDEGENPELEILRFLDKTEFKNVPPYAGSIEYTTNDNKKKFTASLLMGYVENSGSAWTLSLDVIARFYDQVLATHHEFPKEALNFSQIVNTGTFQIPKAINALTDEYYLEMIGLLGKRTAELHLALNSDSEQAEFAPESFSQLYQRSIYQAMQGIVRRNFRLLENQIHTLNAELHDDARNLLSMEKAILDTLRKIIGKKINATKIRTHGDYHLGQVLYTGKDFVIMDFEGEPLRSIGERKIKRSPFRDVAGMIRSFHYAVYNVLFVNSPYYSSINILEPWARQWYYAISGHFLKSYIEAANATIVPTDPGSRNLLLRTFLLDKAVYELGYELNNRPQWVIIPIRSIIDFVKE